MSSGHFIVGLVTSQTTLNEQVAVFDAWSVAEAVTTVYPRGNLLPDRWL